MTKASELRTRVINDLAATADGDFVLYWMTAFRRGNYNFSLEHAAAWAKELGKPLVVFEALRTGYRWASDRIHQFVIEGMLDNQRFFAERPVLYYPYLEPADGAGKGLLKELAGRACVVIGDDFPAFFLPRMVAAAASQIPVRFELIDSNGLLPMRAAPKIFARAFDFRRFLQKNLLDHLPDAPAKDPLRRMKLPVLEALPEAISARWPAADPQAILSSENGVAAFPIDHSVNVTRTVGGAKTAQKRLSRFLKDRLQIYTERNQPQREATSGLSPYLHFGHISAHQVFDELIRQVEWTPDLVAEKANGSSSGWWGADEATESFLDELITWRELGYNMCWQQENYDQYESLPEWARKTLKKHATDPRPNLYDAEQMELAETHDELWNAAQRQLVREGHIHNYLRMLWGKKVLEWSATPLEALHTLIHLNNKYALDGRNPNSYSGIFWVLGRYDRAWGPERPIFGQIRYMSSENTARKVRVKEYIQKYAAHTQQELGFSD